MMRFSYRCGDRPLEGYTIKRGLGAGGFGEVFLGISEGGKEVALKLIVKASEKERRGIAHCLNLKHPNLVHLYDLRQDSEHRYWLVMEYVHGESLKQFIRRHPNGLPLNLIREWFLGLAKGVGFLHDQGVVHRDLKPDNIFVEHGAIKLGDYGLCKSVSAGKLEDATGHAGTALYMAPEVWRSKSGIPVDVYACGIILYEMLTGHTPFAGDPYELMVAHTSDDPDLVPIPQAFRPIIDKALDKEPTRRYASLADMAKDVAAAASPNTLPKSDETRTHDPAPAFAPRSWEATTLDDRAPRRQPVRPAPRGTPPVAAAPAKMPISWRVRLSDMTGSLFGSAILSLAVAAVGAFSVRSEMGYLYGFGRCYFLTVAICWAVLFTGRLFEPDGRKGSWSYRGLLGVLGAVIGAATVWLDGWTVAWGAASPAVEPSHVPHLGELVFMDRLGWATAMSFAIYLGAALGLTRWTAMVGRNREERFSLLPIAEAAFWGIVLWLVWKWTEPPLFSLAALVGAAMIVQALSPWTPPAAERPARRRLRVELGGADRDR